MDEVINLLFSSCFSFSRNSSPSLSLTSHNQKTKRAPKVEVGTGTTDASMDEWLQVCATTLALSEFVISSFLFFLSWRRHFLICLWISRELRIPNLSPTNPRRRSRRAVPTSPLQVAYTGEGGGNRLKCMRNAWLSSFLKNWLWKLPASLFSFLDTISNFEPLLNAKPIDLTQGSWQFCKIMRFWVILSVIFLTFLNLLNQFSYFDLYFIRLQK